MKIKPALNGVLAAGLLMGLLGLPGCSDRDPATTRPKDKPSKDEVQKAIYGPGPPLKGQHPTKPPRHR